MQNNPLYFHSSSAGCVLWICHSLGRSKSSALPEEGCTGFRRANTLPAQEGRNGYRMGYFLPAQEPFFCIIPQLFCIILHNSALFCIFFCTVLHYFELFCIILHIFLHYTALFCIKLHIFSQLCTLELCVCVSGRFLSGFSLVNQVT